MAAESWEPVVYFRPTETQPAEQRLQPPGQDVPGPSQEQVRATDAVFARKEEDAGTAGLFGLWSAGMLLHEIIRDANAKSEEDEQAENKPGRKPASPREE